MLVVFALLYHRIASYALYDPDRYYHLAIARMTAEDGLVRILPQVEDLGWGRAFPEKEFLFHLLMAAAYRLGGETATVAIAPLLAGLVVLTLLVALRGLAPPLWLAYAVLFPVLLVPKFVARMLPLRPHVLAVGIFLWALHGLIRRRRLLTFAACAAYALAYHALHVVGALCLLSAVAHWREPRRWRPVWLTPEAAGLFGLGLGTVANPYFPLNVWMGWQHVRIAVSLAAARVDIGDELRPQPLAAFVATYWFHLLWVFAGVVVLWRAWRARRREGGTVASLALPVLGCVLFWSLTARSPRAVEYAVPLTALLVAQLHRHLPTPRTAWVIGAVLAGLLLVPSAERTYGRPPPAPSRVRVAFAAIDRIPSTPAGAKVFNCTWANTPFILYKRPDLRFVDILDPSFLWLASPELSDLRATLRAARTADPYAVLRGSFHADYVFCSDPALYAQLERDARFTRLFPLQAGQIPNDRRALDLFYVFALEGGA